MVYGGFMIFWWWVINGGFYSWMRRFWLLFLQFRWIGIIDRLIQPYFLAGFGLAPENRKYKEVSIMIRHKV